MAVNGAPVGDAIGARSIRSYLSAIEGTLSP